MCQCDVLTKFSTAFSQREAPKQQQADRGAKERCGSPHPKLLTNATTKMTTMRVTLCNNCSILILPHLSGQLQAKKDLINLHKESKLNKAKFNSNGHENHNNFGDFNQIVPPKLSSSFANADVIMCLHDWLSVKKDVLENTTNRIGGMCVPGVCQLIFCGLFHCANSEVSQEGSEQRG